MRDLYAEHGRMLLAYATRMTGDRGAAEDLVQETMIRAWRHAHIVATATVPLTGWLLTILRNLSFDRARRRAVRPSEVPELPEGGAAHGDHAERIVDSVVVLEALKSLSPEHNRVLVEIYFRHRSVAEVAEMFQIPQGTVKSRTHYAVRALRTALADGVEDR
ncbi:sigma-70 family RNA polymerase sigma factor [Actinomadura sp. 6N118]|uniref:sigma-70 family RNA polymerase sigma factor n=1 Tax=Actinomadura sp. 6N118 TaxID=3375151 RepID=UPI003793279E